MITKQRQVRFASSRLQLTQASDKSLPGSKISYGTEAGKILDIRVLDKDLRETAAFLAGDTMVIQVQIQVDPGVKNSNIRLVLRDQRGYSIYGTDTQTLGVKPALDENYQATICFSLSPVLAPGSYSFVARLDDFITTTINLLLDKQVGVGAFEIIENKAKFFGIVDLQATAYQSTSTVEKRET